jgi:hypothetical protein
MILLDIAPPIPIGNTAGTIVAVVFFLILLAVALFAYKMLMRTVKMAIRMVIVTVILLVAIIGSIALYVFSRYEPPQRPIPTTKQTR